MAIVYSDAYKSIPRRLTQAAKDAAEVTRLIARSLPLTATPPRTAAELEARRRRKAENKLRMRRTKKRKT